VGLLDWVEAFQENSAVAFFVYLGGRSKGHPDLHHSMGHHSKKVLAADLSDPLERATLVV
jgi:hypothetical protein